MRDERGFTLVEVTIILLVLVIISMIMLPQLGNFNRLARKVKLYEDLGAICATLKKFIDEVMVPPYDEPGGNGVAPPTGRVGLLVGPGNLATDIVNPVAPGTGTWALTTADTFEETPDIDHGIGALTSTTFEVDSFDEHIQQNRPGSVLANPQERYKNQVEDPIGVGPYLGWRGPYFDMITTDPFGGRYMSNVFGLHSDDNGNTFSTAVVCYSAGPNAFAETQFNQPHIDPNYGWVTGGDDAAVILSSFGPF